MLLLVIYRTALDGIQYWFEVTLTNQANKDY